MRIPLSHAGKLQSLLLILIVACFAGPGLAQDLTITAQVNVQGQRGKAKRPDHSDVVVWLTPIGASGARPEATKAPSQRRLRRIIQKRKRFEPHMVVIPVGSEVGFPNLDPFFHNVFSLFEGKRFDLGLYEAGSSRAVKFDRPGVCYIFCNIHPEMGAVVVVLDTPYSAISDREGKISIPGVPPGRYRMDLWSEKVAPDELKAFGRVVTLDENSVSLGRIQLSGGNSVLLQHLNKYGQDYDTPPTSSPLYDHP